ncbi:MAG: sigma-70 family RNA polymerase sigma factor [Caldilineaceae bacterium]
MFASPSTSGASRRDQRRDDQLWLADLRGQNGDDAQQRAYLDLANYLYKVAYNYLVKRQTDVSILAASMNSELAELAQDCVQDTLLKLWQNDGALLDQYQGKGRFLAWTALVIRNHVADLLRRPPYTREAPPPADLANRPATDLAPATRLTLQEVADALQKCIDALPPARRDAFSACIVNGERSKAVAARLKRTVNAINQLVFHAKQQIKSCLEHKGIDAQVLELFE